MTSPKTRLMRVPVLRDSLANHLDNPLTEVVVEIAWAQYCLDLPTDNPMSNDLKRQGAREFIDVLLNIAKEQPLIQKSPFPQLKP